MDTYEIRVSSSGVEKGLPLYCRAQSVDAVVRRTQFLVRPGGQFEIWLDERCLYCHPAGQPAGDLAQPL
jgi:hypothetical protein